MLVLYYFGDSAFVRRDNFFLYSLLKVNLSTSFSEFSDHVHHFPPITFHSCIQACFPYGAPSSSTGHSFPHLSDSQTSSSACSFMSPPPSIFLHPSAQMLQDPLSSPAANGSLPLLLLLPLPLSGIYSPALAIAPPQLQPDTSILQELSGHGKDMTKRLLAPLFRA